MSAEPEAESAQPDAKPAPDDDAAIDAVLEEHAGDARAAIKALLHDLDALAADARATVSKGYVRGIDLYEWRRRKARPA